jgi:beta-aspartyl-peptidase (threonine type)
MSPVIAVHGGAGARRGDRPGARHRAALRQALEAGHALLAQGRSSLDAVCAAVAVLEDSPLFNAGRGSCLNADGEVEMDASVMDGDGLRAGAVAAVRRIRNPILAARMVMEETQHVLMTGGGAERLAKRAGLKLEPVRYFRTAESLEAWKRRRATRHGTVGAVALDGEGHLAAATSTGGFSGKLPGRIGDSALIGAGTHADDRACAVSCTGLGEAFIRAVAAHDVVARMLYRGDSVAVAARAVLTNVRKAGGDGGLIAIDREGRVVMPFNSEGMHRGAIDRRGRIAIPSF